MNYLKPLQKQGVFPEDLQALADLLEARAKEKGFSHPNSVYHSTIVDLALGTLEIQKETQSELGKTHNLKEWLDIIVGK
ncbi:hypothetical protein [Sessilibacter corallicola]|uniref:Uncharacterized protein n=1 Tax=Sessilibacter corallicola TaxID=2904075 RepID=A0ABQ0ACZ1_9GAMM|nr:hypothetical protein [Sessilibacter corallicola]MCE2030044.1 hypothetical protein [Sessilibacter corallicola]